MNKLSGWHNVVKTITLIFIIATWYYEFCCTLHTVGLEVAMHRTFYPNCKMF